MIPTRNAIAFCLLTGCTLDRGGLATTDGGHGRDAGEAAFDAGSFDASSFDAGSLDAGDPGSDAGRPDAGAPDAGFDAGPPCVPAPETCNARDDDCDDVIDESGCDCMVGRRGASVYLFCPDRFGEEEMDWSDGRDYCNDRGYYLARVEDEAENTWMMDTAFSFGGAYFIGLSDEEDEGDWQWTDGSRPGFLPWIGGEPNGGDGENCVEVRNPHRGWNDRPCYYDRRFVCETP